MSDLSSRHGGYYSSSRATSSPVNSGSQNTAKISYRVEVDTKKINELLTALNDREAKKAIKAGLRKSAGIIRKQAQGNLVSAVPGAKSSRTGRKPLKNEINIAVYRNASGARVDLLDKRRKGSRAYMLKFFEGGTKERPNRGSINASYFFKSAVDAKKNEAEQSLECNITESINKVIAQKK